jgi:GT2 family glycosyltransferase
MPCILFIFLILSNSLMSRPLFSVVILNYNGLSYAERCLSSVLNSNYPNFEVIFVDNGSRDGSLELVKAKFSGDNRVRIICNERNYGFAEGNNIGIRAARGKYIVLLNIDTEVEENWLDELEKVLERDETIGAAQCKIMRMDDRRRFDECGHMLTKFGFYNPRGLGEEDHGQYDHVTEIFGAKGAAMVLRRSALDKAGLFDPDYFMLAEETDLCWRIWLSGFRVVFVPRSVVYHAVGGIPKDSSLMSFLWYRNRLTNLMKNLELRNVVKILPVFLLLSSSMALVKSMRKGNAMQIFCFVKAVFSVIKSFKRIWIKRKRVQLLRRRKDRELFSRVMVDISFIEKVRKSLLYYLF